MPKPPLGPKYAALGDDVIETFLAGHHRWRPDLPYPESHSDMMGGVFALLLKYEVKLRPIPLSMVDILEPPCPHLALEVSGDGQTPVCIHCRSLVGRPSPQALLYRSVEVT